MTLVLLRDDDASGYTRPEHLAAVYGPALDAGLPVTLAVVPFVRGDLPLAPDNLFRTRFGLTHEPLVPPGRRGDPRPTPVGDNRALRDFVAATGCRVALHGYAHARIDGHREMEVRDRALLGRWLDEGRAALASAFGALPELFVAPWDRLGPAGLAEVRRRFRGLSTGSISWRDLPPTWWPAYVEKRLRRRAFLRHGDFLAVEHPGCLLSVHRPVEEAAERVLAAVRGQPFVVLVNHHWEFFEDWGAPRVALLAAWHTALGRLLADPEVRFVDFPELARALAPHAVLARARGTE